MNRSFLTPNLGMTMLQMAIRCILPLIVLCAATLCAEDGALVANSRVEPLLRALQERYNTVTGEYISLPASATGIEAPHFPEDGFYNGVSQSRMGTIVRDALTSAQFVVAQYQQDESPGAAALALPDLEGMALEDALQATLGVLRQCRYAHFGPGGHRLPIVEGKIRRIDISRATLNPPLDVDWTNAGYARTISGLYDKTRTIDHDEVYALSLRSIDTIFLGYIKEIPVGFEYGYSLTYDLSRWKGISIRPLYSVAWYSAKGSADATVPIWPQNAGVDAAQPPFWIPEGGTATDVDGPSPWFTSYQGRGTIQLHPVRVSDVFAGPTTLMCSERTVLRMNMDVDATQLNTWTPKLSDYSTWFYQIDYRGFIVDLKDQFTQPVPTFEPLDVAGVYAGSCPTNPGVIAGNFSLIDNGSMTYYHDAWDYRIGTVSGCGTCGGAAGSGASTVELSLGRIHRYRDLDWGASFGPGVLCNHDLRLQIFAVSGGGLTARFFDPLQRVSCDLSGGPGASTLLDPASVARSLVLRDADAVPTADLAQARTATLELMDGRTLAFQLFSMQPGDATAIAGRVIRIDDQQGHRLIYTYLNADPVAALALVDAEVAAFWRFSSITDDRGVSASFTWTQAAGQWVMQTATMPGGGTFTYSYADSGLVSLVGVVYPTGESSRFSAGWDVADQWVSLAISDAGADTTHRRKQVFFTPSIETGLAGGVRPQLPNLVRKLINGSNELSYRNWVEGAGDLLDFYNYTGGGVDGAGVLRWVRYQGGRPISSKVAVRYFPDQPFSSHEWTVEADFATDANWRPSIMRDPDGSYTTYERDGRGNITARILHRPDGSEVSRVTTTYDAFNNPVEVTDALQRLTRNAYNAAGLLTKRTVAVGTTDEASWEYDYDSQGRLLTSTDANGHVTDYTYDPVTGQLASIIEPGDAPDTPLAQRPTRRFTYDAAGRPLTSSDQAGRTVTFGYDGRGRQTSATYADGTTEVTVYGVGDDANLVSKRKDRNDVWEEFGYDGNGRQTSAVLNRGQPDQVVRSWAYVPGKNLVASETVNGHTTAYGYDEQGRVASVTTWSSSGVAHTSSSEMWEAQRIAVSTDDRGCRTFAMTAVDGLRSRTVRERLPGALESVAGAGVGERDQRAQALWNLERIMTADPPYTIEETLSDVAGQVLARIDAAGVSSGSLYDQQGRVTETSVADRVSGQVVKTVVAYDPQGNRTQVTAPRSFAPDAPGTFVSSFTYTGRNLVASQTESFTPKPDSELPAITVTTNFTYTLTGQKKSESNPRNPAWLTEFTYGSCCDRLEKVTDATGHETRYDYDNVGRVTSTTDANGHTVGSRFDAQGRVTQRIDGNGKVTRIDYDDDLTDHAGLDERFASAVADLGFGPGAVGSATLTTASTGEQTLEIRDGLGRTVRQVAGAETSTPTITTSRFDLPPVDGLQVVEFVDAAGAITRQYLDGAGRVVRAQLPGGAVTAVSYDVNGNAIAQTDPNGVTTRMAHDDLGRAVLVTDGGGSTVRRAYDEQGNVISETDAMGGTITRVYDGLNRKISETDRLGHTTRFGYNLAGGLETITDAEGGVTSYVYDERNALVSETFPGSSGGTRGRTFDGAGLPKTTTDQRGIVTTLIYDSANRLQTRRYSTGHEDSFTYDDAGRLLTAHSGRYGTTITRTYQDGLLHRETQQRPDGSATLTWHYDTQRRPDRIDLDDGTSITTSFDTRGQVSGGKIDDVTVFTRIYDDGGRVLDTIFPNGLGEHRQYTPANQTKDITVATAPTAPTKVVDITYTYDDNRRKKTEQDRRQSGEDQTFDYDANDRLKTWTRTPGRIGEAVPAPDEQSWKLSKVGDWQETTINGVIQVREHSPVHEVTQVAAVPVSYDANGNMTRDHHGRASAWDADNRLTSVRVHDQVENVSSTAVMVYDALGRRLARTAYGRTTVFVLNGSQVVQERDLPQALSTADIASDGELPAADAPAPEGAILDLPGTWHINHQPATALIPTGWMADKGRAREERTNGLTYGWEHGTTPQALLAGNSFRRDAMPQPELDTLHRLTADDATATWRCALPNGSYAVVIVSGDPVSREHSNHWSLNGQELTDPDPYDPDATPGYNRGDYDGWAVDVTVTDGYLTLAPGAGAFDPALCLIEVGPPGSAVDDALRAKLAGIIERASNRTAGNLNLHPPTPRTYAYGGDYIDAPLAMKAGQGAATQTYFIHSNSLYSPQAVTNEVGQVVERYSYTAYGERTVLGGFSSTTSHIGFNHGFTGLRDEGGLLFARNRYFSPELGRWISRDPAGYKDGYGLYAGYFAPNGVDPTGLATECPEDNSRLGEGAEGALYSFMKDLDAYISYYGGAQSSAYQAAYRAYMLMGYSPSVAAMVAAYVQDHSGGKSKYLMIDTYFNPAVQKEIQVRASYAQGLDAVVANAWHEIPTAFAMAVAPAMAGYVGGGLLAGEYGGYATAMTYATGTGAATGAVLGSGFYLYDTNNFSWGGLGKAAGWGSLSGGVGGFLMVAGGPAASALFGHGALGGAAAGAFAFGGGNAAGQGLAIMVGSQDSFDSATFGGAVTLGAISGSYFFRPSVATQQQVTSWAQSGSPDLGAGRWVMLGGRTARNYRWSGVQKRGYPFNNSITDNVPGIRLKIPTNPNKPWEAMWFILGQRMIR